MRGLVRTFVVLSAVLLVPASSFAQQASIAGVVKDASGAVLPGVSVEATSSVLTEKVRAVVTDGTGQYRIVELPPGTYSLTFTLQGFNVVKREGVMLTGSLTASINVELRVGELQETVTVTGESPIVDVQSARRQQVIDGDVLNTIPTSRSYNNVLQLVPGVVAGDGQVQLRPTMLLFTAHGGKHGGRPPDARRHQHRRVARRRRRLGLHPRHAERGGGDIHHLRQPRRSRNRRSADDGRPEVGRQHLQRLVLHLGPERHRCRATTSTRRS